MTKITHEDIALLWNDMEVRSWEELGYILQNRVEHLDEKERDELLAAVLELRDEPFPDSEHELFSVLSRETSSSPQRIWINDL